ncbi:hypothetical protein PFISCL1PPCAC_12387 [Pristionchus fissidentatus]|uniref:Uncharacterized protein n=1 Tax=Pristionchus fissidentatus TaxID=1538716 RepID=A0AAV5VSV3_9BILA|nr:hypothetical protein PFISCL1PPCAC_12387 [Pristionchus fissidentatus]
MMTNSSFTTGNGPSPKRKREESDNLDTIHHSFYSFARLGKLSIEALKKLAEYSVQDDVFGNELCDVFDRLTVYIRRVNARRRRHEEQREFQMRLQQKSNNDSTRMKSISAESPPTESRKRRHSPPRCSPSAISPQVVAISDDEEEPAVEAGHGTELPDPKSTASPEDVEPNANTESELTPAVEPDHQQSPVPMDLCRTPPPTVVEESTEKYVATVRPFAEYNPNNSSSPSTSETHNNLNCQFSKPDHPRRPIFSPIIRCAFCYSPLHSPIHCSLYKTSVLRVRRSKELGLCQHCLLPYDDSTCRHPSHKEQCEICGRHFSNAAFCKNIPNFSFQSTRF